MRGSEAVGIIWRAEWAVARREVQVLREEELEDSCRVWDSIMEWWARIVAAGVAVLQEMLVTL